MRLTKVRVTKLFGLFDHEIPLNREERITIIHGPNGFGKTVVLRMLAALFSGQYDLFREVPFDTFVVEFDDGRYLDIERRLPGVLRGTTQEPKIKLSLRTAGSSDVVSWKLDFAQYLYERSGGTKQVLGYQTAMRRFRELMERSASSEARQLSIWEAVALGDSAKHLSPDKVVSAAKNEPEWLADLRTVLPFVRLVRTQRLDVVEYAQEDSYQASKPTVEAYSRDISVRIRQALAEYASKSQELDRTFPARLFGQRSAESPAAEELRGRLSALEQRRLILTRLGFLEPEHGLEQASVQAIDAKRDVLSVYVDDVEKKLAVFDDMAQRVQLFTRIINERFLFKSLEIQRDQGFVFTSTTGARLRPSDLSSGEQHELILLYELLFKLQKNALVLLDEPEISLHVAWQEKFLGDLMEVVKLSEIDVVVATHSPEIIGEHWDLTVELKGPSELRKD